MRFAALPLLLVLAGCDVFGPGVLGVSLTAEMADDVASLQVENTGEAAAEFRPPACAAVIEVRDGGAWRDSGYESLAVCTADLVRLEAGDVSTAAIPVGGLPEGSYRFRLAVGAAASDNMVLAVSNEVAR